MNFWYLDSTPDHTISSSERLHLQHSYCIYESKKKPKKQAHLRDKEKLIKNVGNSKQNNTIILRV